MRTLSYKKIVHYADSVEVSSLPSSLNNSLILEGASIPITEASGNVLFGPVIDVTTTPLKYNNSILSILDFVPRKNLCILNKKPLAAPDVLWFENENAVFYKINAKGADMLSNKPLAVKVKAVVEMMTSLSYEEDLDYYIFPYTANKLVKGDNIILSPKAPVQLGLKAPIGRYKVYGDMNIAGQTYICCRYVDTPEFFYTEEQPENIFRIYYYYVSTHSHEVEFSTDSLKKTTVGNQVVYTGVIKSNSPIFSVSLVDALNDLSTYTINGKTATIQIHENDYDNVVIKYVCSDIEF